MTHTMKTCHAYLIFCNDLWCFLSQCIVDVSESQTKARRRTSVSWCNTRSRSDSFSDSAQGKSSKYESFVDIRQKYDEFVFRKHENVFVFCIFSQHSEGADYWRLPSRKKKSCLFCLVHTMAADVLAASGTRASATMAFILHARNILI